LKISAKKAAFLVSSGKTKFHHFRPLLEKLLEKSISAPLKKIIPTPIAHKHVKLHHFCKKLCCITPPGNTVQQR